MDRGIPSFFLGGEHEPVSPVDDGFRSIAFLYGGNAQGHGDVEGSPFMVNGNLRYQLVETGGQGNNVLFFANGADADEFLAAPAAYSV